MLEHLEPLCSLYGISGNEKNVRDYIIENIEGKCSYYVDALGNIIAFKPGKKEKAKKIMIAAHMDEVGMIVTDVNSDGTLSFEAVGGVNSEVIAGRQVYIYEKNIQGVIGSKAVHNMSSSERDKKISAEDLCIDIGASDKEDAEKYISPGDCVTFMSGSTAMGDDSICSKALDDRAGCAIMLDLINTELDYGVYFVFTVQEEVGLRGAGTAAFQVSPDFAIVLETTTASDISGVSGASRVCELGKGAVVSYMDKRTVYDRELYELAFSLAEKAKINCQTKTLVAGGNDAGAIHISGNGVRTIAVSAPCRYLHSPSCMARRSDIEACENLTKLLITGINKL
ncbi:MAG: M42 family metallopeptidase [Ruminococcus sp.]|nr:M42 family metallopeptidase [Ruminococcus sp.]